MILILLIWDLFISKQGLNCKNKYSSRENIMKYKKSVIILLIISLVTVYNLYSQEEESKVLKWKTVEGAASYMVEIKKGERSVLKTESTDNFVYLDLPPGEYIFNISVLNKFSKKTSETGWKKLTIEAARQPAIKKYSPDHIYLNKDKPLLEIDAYNIKERSMFLLVPESGDAVEGKIENVDNSVYKVIFPEESLKTGFYSLSVTNPSGLKDTAVEKFEVREDIVPSVGKISEDVFLNKGVYSGIKIEGENFEENIKIEFRSDSKVIYPASVKVVSADEISAILDLTSAEPGKYRIYVENPSGLSDFSKKTIQVHERTDESELMMKGFVKDIVTVLCGYEYGYFLEDVSDYHNYNYAGIIMRAQFDFNNDFFNKYIWLYPIGAEIFVAHYPKDIYFNEFGFNIYYKSRFQNPVNFIVKGGGGFSIFEDMEYAPEYGRVLVASGGLSVKLLKHLALEATTGFKTWNVEGDYLNYIVNSVSAGITF